MQHMTFHPMLFVVFCLFTSFCNGAGFAVRSKAAECCLASCFHHDWGDDEECASVLIDSQSLVMLDGCKKAACLFHTDCHCTFKSAFKTPNLSCLLKIALVCG